MSLFFTADQENGLSVTYSQDAVSLRAVGDIIPSTGVKDVVEKKVSELNLIRAASLCIAAFKNSTGTDMIDDLRNMRRTHEFTSQFHRFGEEYHAYGFNWREIEILTYSYLTRRRNQRVPHRRAPSPPAAAGTQ